MIAIYPGSFDPVTNGHMDIIRRVAALSDTLVIGVLDNRFKKSLFTAEQRIRHLKLVTEELANVEIEYFSGLLMDFAHKKNANVVVRGIRGEVIPEYEYQTAIGNRQVSASLGRPPLETLFMLATPEYMYISSSMVKEVLANGGAVDGMVPDAVLPDLYKNKTEQHIITL